METVTDFIFSKITVDGDYSHEIKRLLLLGRKAMINLDSILKSRDITLPTKVHPVELFQILKDDAVKVLHSICQQISNTQQWPQDRKRSVFIPIPKKGNAKECSNYCTIAIVSHASTVMLKIFQARLQQYRNHKLPDVQARFRKGRGTRDQVANIC